MRYHFYITGQIHSYASDTRGRCSHLEMCHLCCQPKCPTTLVILDPWDGCIRMVDFDDQNKKEKKNRDENRIWK